VITRRHVQTAIDVILFRTPSTNIPESAHSPDWRTTATVIFASPTSLAIPPLEGPDTVSHLMKGCNFLPASAYELEHTYSSATSFYVHTYPHIPLLYYS